MYSINDGPFGIYTEPFYLPGKSGFHTVKFYAVDNTNNTVNDDFNHSVGVVYVDLTGPAISHSFLGPTFVKADTVYVNPKTKVALVGSDPEAGLKQVAYAFNNSTTEEIYTNKPVELSATGFQTLNYFGYDNVNNKNSKSTFFIVDSKGPEIAHQFAGAPNKERYPSYTSIYLSATDSEVGADQIRYSLNGAKEQLYIAPIKGFAKNKEYTMKITATDLLGNTSTTEVKFRTDRY